MATGAAHADRGDMGVHVLALGLAFFAAALAIAIAPYLS
jgi:hypothetical protein